MNEWGENIGKRAEEWGKDFPKRIEKECFGIPHGSTIIGLNIGIIIILIGPSCARALNVHINLIDIFVFSS